MLLDFLHICYKKFSHMFAYLKETLAQIFDSQNWNTNTYQAFIVEYGPAILIALIFLIIGKVFFGKIRLQWSKLYDRKGISTTWSRFLSRNNHIKFRDVWKDYFSDKANRVYFITSLVVGLTLCLMSAKLIAHNADTAGKLLEDPIMMMFSPMNWSPAIFALEYFALVAMVFYVSDQPGYFIKCLWGVTVLQIVRSISIILVPLAPPVDMIFLVDPFTQFFFGENVQVSNDLFFSGHVSLLALFYFAAQNKYMKIYLFIATFLVGLFLIWQHVHYSYDVLFAPLASFAIYKLVIANNWSEQLTDKYRSILEVKS